jgi:hypothetical protein
VWESDPVVRVTTEGLAVLLSVGVFVPKEAAYCMPPGTAREFSLGPDEIGFLKVGVDRLRIAMEPDEVVT